MMEMMLKKLKSRAGESLAETLVALLIAAFALVMLAGAISASFAMITSSEKKLDAYYNQNEELAKMGTATGSVSKGITLSEESGAVKDSYYDIKYYKNAEFTKNPVISYEWNH